MSQGDGPEPEQLSLAECARLLNVPWRHVRRMIKRGVFAQPAGHDSTGQPYWHRRSLYAWAAADRDLLGRVPLHHWRPPAAPACYLGAETIENMATALGWHTSAGPVWMLWHWDFDAATYERDLTELAKYLPGAAAITMVGGDYGADGPALFGVLPAAPAQPVYEMPWSALSNVIGTPAPFWPRRLRIPDLMNAWRPGDAPVAAAAVPDLDPTPMLRLAVIVDEGSPAQQTLVNLVQTWQHRATMTATSDLKMLKDHTTAATTTVAATPLTVPAVEKDDLAPDIRRAGWLEILARTDDLALACVHRARRWGADEDFPSSDVGRSRRKRRLRLTVWAAMLLATISVLQAWDDLMKVLATWWDGQQTSDLEVLGWKVLYYGRVGKAVLLLAGLVVIFDLLDPDAVKNWGKASKERAERALARSRHNRQAVRLSRLRESVVADMMTKRIIAMKRDFAVVRYWITKAAPRRVPDGLDITLDTYRRFHCEVIGELSGIGDPDDPEKANPHRYAHVGERVEAFLADHLSSDDQAKLALSGANRRESAGSLVMFIMGPVVGFFAFFLWGLAEHETGMLRLVMIVVGCAAAVLGVGLMAVSTTPTARMWAASVLWSLIRVIVLRLAATLQRAKPFHTFRWIAFGLFFVGSLVDLLAS
ncbi:hypothetical protein [Streptosporangium saharense]|uniref:hypothetical protein n=1 Tax=Streptosporangium saharense TaxID=1706840 RepID=UPI0033249236